jgi:hypothetical protein
MAEKPINNGLDKQPENSQTKSSGMAKLPECRVCMEYDYDHDVDVFSFRCKKGFFDFTDSPLPVGQEGRLPLKGSVGGEMPCSGEGFSLDIHSRWYRPDTSKQSEVKNIP